MTKTYKINYESKRIVGKVSGRESLVQWVLKALQTPKAVYPIYSKEYGINILDLVGKSFTLIQVDLEEEIKKCLLANEEILNVSDFSWEKIGDQVKVKFKVNSVYGIDDISSVLNF